MAATWAVTGDWKTTGVPVTSIWVSTGAAPVTGPTGSVSTDSVPSTLVMLRAPDLGCKVGRRQDVVEPPAPLIGAQLLPPSVERSQV